MICSFNSEVAQLAGVDSAVLLEYIFNKCLVDNPIRLTVKGIVSELPFYTDRQIRYALTRLWNLELINRHEISSRVIAYSLTETGKSYFNNSQDSNANNGNLGFVMKKRVFTNIHKTNQFIKNCETVMNKFVFDEEVRCKLIDYFRYLAEQNCLLPKRSINQQLVELSALSEENMKIAIDRTVSHGWKALSYMVDDITSHPDKYISTNAAKNIVADFDGGAEF